MKIRLLGQRSPLGGGVHFAEFSDAFQNLRLLNGAIEEVDATDRRALDDAIRRSTPEDINIWFWPDPAMGLVKGIRVVWAIFESDRLPHDYVAYLRDVAHVIWTPSAWARGVLVDSGLDPAVIDVVPEGVNPRNFHRLLRVRRAEKPGPFTFLALGKYEERKGYGALFEAFAAFGDNPDVRLIVKADFFADFEDKKAQFERLVRATGLSTIKMLWGAFDADMMLALFTRADAFVFPSRAEGWGLPLIEAMATGLPAITTCYSGHTEFLQPVESLILKIDHDLEAIQDPEYLGRIPGLQDLGPRWAAPRAASILDNMRRVIAEPETWDRAAMASDALRQTFSWRQAVERAYACLRARKLVGLTVGFPQDWL